MAECVSRESLPESETITSVLNMFYTAGIPVEPLLEIWKTNLNDKGMTMISNLVLYNLNAKGTYIADAFIPHELSDMILNWIRANKEEFMSFIEDFIMNSDNNEKFQELSYCYDFLKYF